MLIFVRVQSILQDRRIDNFQAARKGEENVRPELTQKI